MLEDILLEIRDLREAFEETNRILDGRLAQIQSQTGEAAPPEANTVQPMQPGNNEQLNEAVLNELAERDA